MRWLRACTQQFDLDSIVLSVDRDISKLNSSVVASKKSPIVKERTEQTMHDGRRNRLP
jgi:hypothetical protein